MNPPFTVLEAMVAAALATQDSPTSEFVRETIDNLRTLQIAEEISDDEAEQLARQFEERINITQHIGSVLTEGVYRPWLDAARAELDPYYWARYRSLLAHEGLPVNAVSALDDVTDRILDLLQDPSTQGPWDRRGMVIGHVQSGKTQNYTGLICKAADAGYKLIVVIAGIHNRLRNQTQARIDDGFIGRDSASLLRLRQSRFIGVGQFDQRRRPVTFTNSLRDFNKSSATSVGVPLQNLNEPAVFVIKKNANTLKNLIEWLKEHSALAGSQRIDEPMLLIDDEADNASINIRRDALEVSRINGQIRDLLQIFDRSCCIGYTATPFANIFIDPDTVDEMLGQDLFPRSFIVSLDPPSNYFGASTVFLDDSSKYVRTIEDNEDHLPLVHDKDAVITSLPPSLVEALRTFVIAKAIRMARGQQREHCSMLVNASRFINVQRQLRNELHSHIDRMRISLSVNGSLPHEIAIRDSEIRKLREVWTKEYRATEFDWPEILAILHKAVSTVRIIEVNSQSSAALNYQDYEDGGLNVVAVGGYSLSRGLTLEGLTVSYFMRNSIMYDTLMQMGRWFGYRPYYQDLCRIWMPEEAQGWYEHITESAESLREEIRSMEAAGATPEEFGLKIRSHPDTLIVTARNKMGTGEQVVVNVGLANRLVETHMLLGDSTSLELNRAAAARFARRIAADGYAPLFDEECKFGWLSKGVPVVPVIEFLTEFRNHAGALLTHGEPIRRYIEERQDDELANWDVLFSSVRLANDVLIDDSLGVPIRCQKRTAGDNSDAGTLLVSNRQRVSTRGIEMTGLDAIQRTEAEAAHRVRLTQEGRLIEGATPNYPDRIYRQRRIRPLLVVHLLDIQEDVARPDADKPVVAWSISFPETRRQERRVEYVVNTAWLREHYGGDLDEDEMLGDDG